MRGNFDFQNNYSSRLMAIALIAFAALSSACGPMSNGHYVSTTSSTSQTSALGLGSVLPPASTTSGGGLVSGTVGRYQCAGTQNVTPRNYLDYNSGQFQICPNPQSQSDVLVVGNEGTDQVCVFPAQVLNSGSGTQAIAWKPDPNAGGAPWYICEAPPPANSGLVFTFQGVSWNAAYVVSGRNVQAMQGCLIFGAGSQFCAQFPQYSYGTFR